MLFPINKILCPVDLSKLSAEGFRAGVELAQKIGAEVVVLHVVAPIPTTVYSAGMGVAFDVPGYQRELKNQRETELQGSIDKLEPLFKDIKVSTEVRFGATAESIVNAAEEGNFDMIVMSTHGETGLKRFVMGSVTERVVRLADLPVLCIHPRGDDSN